MAEEDSITSDDLDVLRVLLHNIKGISAVSTAPDYVPDEPVGDDTQR